MLGFGKKKGAAPKGAGSEDDENDDLDAVKEAEKPAPKAKGKDLDKDGDDKPKSGDGAPDKAAADAKPAGKMGLIIGFAVLTLVAGGAGAGAGMMFASSLEQVY